MSGSSDYTLTPNLGLFKPTFNADVSNWGQHWNQNADTLDSAIHAAGIPDAPSTGQTYGRLNAAWTQVLPLSGGTISGPLTISGTLTQNGARVSMPHLPTSTGTPADLSSKGIVTGDLYNNGGVVCIAP
jgi:hypothetical protein